MPNIVHIVCHHCYLLSQDIKLTTLRRSAQEEAAQEGDAFGVVMATAQTKIITQIVKKNALDNIVPIVIATKHLVSCLLMSNTLLSEPPSLIMTCHNRLSTRYNTCVLVLSDTVSSLVSHMIYCLCPST